MNLNLNMGLYKEVFKNNEELDKDVYKKLLAEQLILRDYLAIERTVLTNEATFLAYVRTSLTIIVVGVTLFHLSPNNEMLQYIGVVFALFGFFTFLLGSTRTLKMKYKINQFLKKRDKLQ